MSSDNITFRGFVGTDLSQETSPNGTNIVSFRLGSANRRYDQARGEWVDAHVNWFTVQCYRNVADNVLASVRKGQRVIVIGKLRLYSIERDGRVYQQNTIKVETIGHDLMWGTADFTRSNGMPEEGNDNDD